MAKAQGEEAFNKRRLRFSHGGVVLSIGLVLFLTGIMATLAYQSQVLTDDLKENFTFTLFLKPGTPQERADAFIKEWSDETEIRSLKFVGKDQAAQQFQKDLGEDFVDFLGFNPLSDAIDIKLKADFVSPDQLATLQERFAKSAIVDNMAYDRDLVSVIHQNVGKINSAMLAAVLLLLLVSLMLINNALRLAIYARRFILKTMQLVGATKSFIHKPFFARGPYTRCPWRTARSPAASPHLLPGYFPVASPCPKPHLAALVGIGRGPNSHWNHPDYGINGIGCSPLPCP